MRSRDGWLPKTESRGRLCVALLLLQGCAWYTLYGIESEEALRDPKNASALVEVMQGSVSHAEDAQRALLAMGEGALPALLPCIKSSARGARVSCIEVAAPLIPGRPQVLSAVLFALSDVDFAVRLATLNALTWVEKPTRSTLEVIAKVAEDDSDGRIRDRAESLHRTLSSKPIAEEPSRIAPAQGAFRFSAGVVISSDGWILTVDRSLEGAKRIGVVFWDGRRAEAKVLKRAARLGLVVLEVKASALPHLQPARAPAQAGASMIVVGYPKVGVLSAPQVVERPKIQSKADDVESLRLPRSLPAGFWGSALVDEKGRYAGLVVPELSGKETSSVAIRSELLGALTSGAKTSSAGAGLDAVALARRATCLLLVEQER